ncbi:hypothetical protein MSG28_009856 [Choristoneura fumiferana]|uniref:Uncharacterized protein n=1 Tax=Choristoneura fumiferana TaxID=7141 RepID=A0ACC0JCX5_CHOFU|nr:hypothetical protein MSG28_009856 [Choristoneura fumiferana]
MDGSLETIVEIISLENINLNFKLSFSVSKQNVAIRQKMKQQYTASAIQGLTTLQERDARYNFSEGFVRLGLVSLDEREKEGGACAFGRRHL